MNRTLGSLVAVLALLVGNGLTPGATAADSLPTGPEVVDRYIEAIGGRAAVAEIQSFHVTGSYVHSSLGNKEGTIDLIFMRPAQLIFTVEMPGSVRIQRGLVDGKAWQTLPGQGGSQLVVRAHPVRLDSHGLAEMFDGIIVSTLPLQDDRKLGRMSRRPRVDTEDGEPSRPQETGQVAQVRAESVPEPQVRGSKTGQRRWVGFRLRSGARAKPSKSLAASRLSY